jgi:hypothetical protein
MRSKVMITILLLSLFGVPSGALAQVSACQTAVLSTLANVTCVRGEFTITYPDLDHIWAFTPSGPGTPVLTADDIVLVMDPNGPNAILIGAAGHWSTGWSVTAGQRMEGTIYFTVSSTSGKTGLAQLGASVTEDGSVYLANNIDSNPPVVSSLTCNSQACTGDNWGKSFIHFQPGTYSASYNFVIDGGTGGTAALQEGSEHF